MAAFDINSPSAALGCAENSALPCLAFSPVLCAADFVLSFSAFISFYAIGSYIMFREYRDCMFRSEWLKDAKFKSLVANDRTDWCLKDRKGQSRNRKCISLVSNTLTLTAILTMARTMNLQ